MTCMVAVAPVILAVEVPKQLLRPHDPNLQLDKARPSDHFPNDPQAQALAVAAAEGDVRKIDKLIDAGANVNAVGVYGVTVPEWVLFHPNKNGFRRLLERGANPNLFTVWRFDAGGRRDYAKQTSLMDHATLRSCELGTDYLRMALDIGGGNPNLVSPDHGNRPINYTVRLGCAQAFRLLRDRGAELNFRSADGMSFLERAIPDFPLEYYLLTLRRGDSWAVSLPDGISGRMSRALYSDLNGPFGQEYSWLWRCVFAMERRGGKLIADKHEAPPLRPARLAPPVGDPLDGALEPLVLSRRVVVGDVALTIPRPVWDRFGGARVDYKSNQADGFARYVWWSYNRALMELTVRRGDVGSLSAFAHELSGKQGQVDVPPNLELVESAPDYEIYRTSRRVLLSRWEDYLYVGRCGETLVSLLCEMDASEIRKDPSVVAYMLKGLREVNLSPGGTEPQRS